MFIIFLKENEFVISPNRMYGVQAHVGFICGGENHCAFLSNVGQVFVTGSNQCGQLGMEDESIKIPKEVPNIPLIRAISCGAQSTICIDMDGNAWGFGGNTLGQLGLGDTEIIKLPTKIPNLPPIVQVECGIRHTLLRSEDSSLWSFGSNKFSQLFLDTVTVSQKSPMKTSFSNIINITAGNACSYAQNIDGEILVCGYNACGQLGLGSNAKALTAIPIIDQPQHIVAMSCTSDTTLLLDEDGSVFGAGVNFSYYFTKIQDLPKIISISCGANCCKFVDEEGNLWVLGVHNFDSIRGKREETPKLMDVFQNVEHISYVKGYFEFIKDQNGIFTCGRKIYDRSQLGSFPLKKLDDDLIHIVGNKLKSAAKSARK